MQVLASQLHFLANKNAELAIPPLFWPVNCIKIAGHLHCWVTLLFIPYTVAKPSNTRIKNLSFRPTFLRQNKEKWVLIKSDHCFTKTKTMIWLNECSLYLCLAVKFGPEAEILDPWIPLLFKWRMANFTKTLPLVGLARIQYARNDEGSLFLHKPQQIHGWLVDFKIISGGYVRSSYIFGFRGKDICWIT